MGLFVPTQTAQTAGAGIFAPTRDVEAPQPIFGLGLSQGTFEQTALDYGSTPLSQYMEQQQLAQAQAAGFTGDLADFTTAMDTPEAQRQANETAIAKIASANPELAEELIGRMNNEGKDQSLWDNIKDAAGDILSVPLQVGKGLLDLISRPAQIIPELIVDEENDPWYEDVGQALSGNSRARGADVMEKWGVEGGIGKAIGGFAFDVLADPLTWATFGTAGLGRRIASEAAGTMISKGLLTRGLTGKLTASELPTFVDDFGRALTNASGAVNISADAMPGIVADTLNVLNKDGISEAVLTAARRGDDITRAMQQGGNIKKIASTEELDILRAIAKGGVGADAKRAAAALGGMRFRATVPFTKLRVSWTSGALPGTEGMHLFGPMSNFLRGTSGMTRLRQYVTNNPSIGEEKAAELMRTWISEGFAGVVERFPQTAAQLGGNRLGLGGALWSASHRVGRITAHMNPHANLLRHGGLAGIATMNASAAARGLRKSLYDGSFQLAEDSRGGALNRAQFAKAVRPIRDADPARKALMVDWLEAAPSRALIEAGDEKLVETMTTAAARIRDRAVKRADAMEQAGVIPPEKAEALRQEATAAYEAAQETAKADAVRIRQLHSQFTPEEQTALEALSRGFQQAMESGNRFHKGIGARNVTVDHAWDLNPRDAVRHNTSGRPELNGVTADEVAGAGPGGHLTAALPDGAPTATAIKTHADIGARGIRFAAKTKRTAPSAGWREVSPDEFVSAQQAARPGIPKERQPYLTWGTTEEIQKNKTRTFLSEDGKAGFAIEPDGEITMLFNGGKRDADALARGESVGQRALKEAQELGGTHLNAFGNGLTDFYETAGFRAVSSQPWNPDYATPEMLASKMATDKPDYWRMEPTATRVSVRAENPLILRGQNKLEGHDQLWDQWHSEGRAILADPERRLAWFGDKVDESNWQQFEDELVSDIVTTKAKKSGFDSLVRYGDNDEVLDGVVFMDPQDEFSRMWAIADDAADVVADRGYFPHMRTSHLRAIEEGERHAEGFHPSDLMHAKERRINKTAREYNDELKAEYGIDEAEALELDPLRAFDLYATHVADGAAREVLGFATRRIGNTYGGGASSLVTWLNRYDGSKGFLTAEQLAKQGPKAREAYEKQNRNSLKVLAAEERKAELLAYRKTLLEEQAILGQGGTRLAAAARKASGADAKAVSANARSLEKVNNQLRGLRKQLAKGKNTDRITEKIVAAEKQRDFLKALDAKLRTGGRLADDEAFGRGDALENFQTQLTKAVSKNAEDIAATERKIRGKTRAMEGAIDELNKIRTRMETHMARPTPAFTTDKTRAGYVRLDAVHDSLRGMHAHPYIAEELMSALGGRNISVLQKHWRAWVNGPWKTMATVYFPGFHVRNHMGAWFNNWLGGVGVDHYILSHRLSRSLHPKNKWHGVPVGEATARRFGVRPETTWDQLADTMHNHGVRGSNSLPLADGERHLAEISQALGERRGPFLGGKGKAARVREAVTDKVPVGRAARAATEITENWHRQAAMLRGLEVTGGDWGNARAFTMMRHGDYEDLNDFEETIKDLVPFYKWMRTNIPFQIRNLMEQPGKQLAVLKAAQNAQAGAGIDPDELKARVPEWMEKSLAFPLSGLKNEGGPDQVISLMALDLPLADLFQGGNDYLGAFLPAIRPIIESTVVGKNVWSGVPLEGKQVRVASWMGLPVIRNLLDPFITEDADGNLTMDDRTANSLSAIPIFSRFRNWVFAEDNNVENRMASLASAFTGVRPTQAGPEQLNAAEKEFFYNEIEPVIAELRELGVTLPEPGQLSPEIYSYLGLEPPAEEEEGT